MGWGNYSRKASEFVQMYVYCGDVFVESMHQQMNFAFLKVYVSRYVGDDSCLC